ncbi:MAG TPA: DNA-processing protein DprA [Gammaproteobacteria bacterium]|nr:DNA-processing protein DprA [Gammaproteobacteria bacterium]
MINHWLALSRLPGVGPVTARSWLEYFKTIENLFAASNTDLQDMGINPKHIHSLKNINWKIIEDDLLWFEKNNCHVIALDSPHYPELLKEIHDPPIVLYAKGNINILSQSQLAIVGSRHPTVTGKELAHYFAKELALAGLTITSGLALGIDAASHRGALASSGKTIAVLGTGLKFIYPRSHQKLAEDIIKEDGLLISEFSPETPPKAIHFPMRNRIISGLSLGVLVVEAAVRSGSLITARSALEQNRDVFAIPGSINNPLARGCHLLIRQGAKLVETAQDILEEIGISIQPQKAGVSSSFTQEPVDLDPKLQRVLAQIGYEVTALDAIILRSGLTASEVSSMLLPLELEGYVRAVPGGYMRF